MMRQEVNIIDNPKVVSLIFIKSKFEVDRDSN